MELIAIARLLEPAAAIVNKFLFAGRDPDTVLNLVLPLANVGLV